MSIAPENLLGSDTIKQLSVTEPEGTIDNQKKSTPDGPKQNVFNPSILNAVHNSNDGKLKKDGTNYGFNDKVGKESTEGEDPKDSAHKRAKSAMDEKNSKRTKSDNPTAASQDPAKNIIDAIMGADPNNVVGAVQKALHAMVALKMMDGLTSPGGVNSMLSGALSGALQNMANQMGLSGALNLLNTAMPELSGMLNASMQGALNQAIVGMISNAHVGALAPQAIQAANVLTNTIADAVTSGSVGAIVNTAAAIGGPALGLDPTSLAAKIANATSGAPILTSTDVNGVRVVSTIHAAANLLTANIPILTGQEPVNIAQTAINGLTSDLMSLVSGGGNASAIFNILNSHLAGIANQGLQQILGSSLNNMLSNAQNLVPNLAGNLQATINAHLPKTVLDPTKMNAVMNEATKVLGLGRMAFKIANIFSANLSEMDQMIHDAMLQKIAALGKGVSLSVVTASGTKMTFNT